MLWRIERLTLKPELSPYYSSIWFWPFPTSPHLNPQPWTVLLPLTLSLSLSHSSQCLLLLHDEFSPFFLCVVLYSVLPIHSSHLLHIILSVFLSPLWSSRWSSSNRLDNPFSWMLSTCPAHTNLPAFMFATEALACISLCSLVLCLILHCLASLFSVKCIFQQSVLKST